MPTLKVKFSTTKDETLIHCVSTYPALYDAADETHRDHVLKDNVWEQVATTVKRTAEDCKTRWKNIRDSYMKKKRANKHGTGSAAKPKKQWSLMGSLDFLNSVASERSTQSNMKLPEDVPNAVNANNSIPEVSEPADIIETAACWEGVSSPETPPPEIIIPPSRKRSRGRNSAVAPKRRRSDSRDFLNAIAARSSEREQLLHLSMEDEIDDTMLFFKSMGTMGKSLPRKLLAEAKISVLQIMLDLQNRAAEDPSPGPSVPRNRTDDNHC